ncbi:hypothetical protein AB0M45_20905 [Nocardia sp. NPDC051787]|uniref:hypothetical protein n=1 Tax=Nocardia sp. NPDC051787 TaxID=3155415 RepID=UPI003418EFE3
MGSILGDDGSGMPEIVNLTAVDSAGALWPVLLRLGEPPVARVDIFDPAPAEMVVSVLEQRKAVFAFNGLPWRAE